MFEVNRNQEKIKGICYINIFIKNSSLVTYGHNTLTDKMLRRDELQLQLITSCLIKDKILFFS